MTDWTGLYHRLPYPLRSIAASMHGLRLRRWRYGEETDRLIAAALAREHWSQQRWRDWQGERLARLLHRAAKQVPWYRAHWQKRRAQGDRASPERLENWPVLDKQTLRDTPRAFLADDCDPRRMRRIETSGSSGTPTALWRSRSTERAWYALHDARTRHWSGLNRHMRWGMLGGHLVSPRAQSEPPFWVWNAGMCQLYLSVFHLTPHWAGAYADALRRHRVTHLIGYSSALHALALALREASVQPPRIKVIFSNAEPLNERQRQDIEQVFGCPCRETYGMGELATAASECEHGSLHLWPEAGILEVLPDQDPIEPPAPDAGRFAATGLINADMPLIRYQPGDRGPPPENRQQCPCGRTLPLLPRIDGRLSDVIRTPDGRTVGLLHSVFLGELAVREGQIVQERLDELRLRFVPAPGYGESDGVLMLERLRERVGERMRISLEPVDHIERGPRGKFPAIVSRLNDRDLPVRN